MDSGLSPSAAVLGVVAGVDDPGRWLAVARERRDAGDLDAAHTVLSVAAQRFADVAGIHNDYARLAEARGDWPAAEQAWRAFLAVDPRPWWGYVALANTLREQGRIGEAEAVLTDEMQRQPNEPALIVEYARLAERSGDWALASQRWEAAMSRFPDVPEGYTGQARALRALGRSDDAAALLLQALERFPNSGSICHDLGRLAEARRDWPDAERWWRAFLAIDTRPWWAYTALANALREQGRIEEAEAVLASEMERQPSEPALFVEYARLAERGGDWDQAAGRWEATIARFPNTPEAYFGAARALRERGRPGDAKALLLQATQRFPDSAVASHDLAKLAEAERDWAAAERWWRAFLAIDPRPWWAHTALANALREASRFAEADEVLAAQIAQAPHEREFALEYARMAERTARLDMAVPRWRDVVRRFPQSPDGYVGQARALRTLGRRTEAGAVIAEALALFPTTPDALREAAHCAEALHDWGLATTRWRALIAADPGDRWPRLQLIWAMRRKNDLTDIDRIISEAKARFPDDAAFFAEDAITAAAAGRWADAKRLWAAHRDRFPDLPVGYLQGAIACQRLNDPTEAIGILADGLGRLPADLDIALAHAEAAQSMLAWRDVAARFPHVARVAARFIAALRASGERDQAEAEMALALVRFPDDPLILCLEIDHRTARGDWHDAVRLAARLRTAAPQDEQGYFAGVDALVKTEQIEAALQLLAEGVAALPDNGAMLHKAVWMMGNYRDIAFAGDWLQTRYRVRFGQNRLHAAFGAGLRYARLYDEGRDYFAGLPDDIILADDVVHEAAVCALLAGDYDEAIRRYEQASKLPNLRADSRYQMARAHAMKADWDTACDILFEEARFLPVAANFWADLFKYAVKAGRTSQAATAWRTLITAGKMISKDLAEIAWQLLASAPPDDLAMQALDTLLQQEDDGTADWMPAIHHLEGMQGWPDSARLLDVVKQRASRLGNQDYRCTASMLRSFALVTLSNDEMLHAIRTCAQGGRVAILSRILLKQDRDRVASALRTHIDDLNARWTPDAYLEVYVCLVFSATFTEDLFFALLRRLGATPGETPPSDLATPGGVVMAAARSFQALETAGAARLQRRTGRPKIAICVSGQLRGFRSAFATWNKAFNLQAVDYDIYVHTWSEIGFNWARMWDGKMDRYPDLRNILLNQEQGLAFLRSHYPNAHAYIMDLIAQSRSITQSELQDFYGARAAVVEPDPPPGAHLSNIWKLHTKVERCHALATAADTGYDLIVRIRPDLKLLSDAPLDWEKLLYDCYRNNIVYTDYPIILAYTTIACGDQLAIGRGDVMDAYASLASTVERRSVENATIYDTPKELFMHRSLALHLIQAGITPRRSEGIRSDGLANPMIDVQQLRPRLMADIGGRAPTSYDSDFVAALGGSLDKGFADGVALPDMVL